jgi:hypothetical protein
MRPETRTPLTPLDLCTLIAHETVSLLNADPEAAETAAQLREGLQIVVAANELISDAGPLVTWVDWEMASVQQFAKAGIDAPPLIDPDRLLPVPDAYAQMDAVWMIFQTAVERPLEQRHILLNMARTLTEIGGLEDMLLTTNIPAVGFLTAEDLRAELEDVRMALQPQETQEIGQPVQSGQVL